MHPGSDEFFATSITAPRKAGKSVLVKTLLKNGLDKNYDHVIIMCPTLDFNDDYVQYINNEKYTLLSKFTDKDIRDIIDQHEVCMRKVRHRERYEKDKEPLVCPRTLLILDDCIDSGVTRFRGVIDMIAERGRHINLSLIVIAQRLSAISRSVRLNSDYFIIFSPYSISELESFLEQFVSKQFHKELRPILNDIFKTPYEFILLDNTERNPSRKLKQSNADDFVKGDVKLIQLEGNRSVTFKKLSGRKRSRKELNEVEVQEE